MCKKKGGASLVQNLKKKTKQNSRRTNTHHGVLQSRSRLRGSQLPADCNFELAISSFFFFKELFRAASWDGEVSSCMGREKKKNPNATRGDTLREKKV